MQKNPNQQPDNKKNPDTHTYIPPLLAKVQLEKLKIMTEAKIIIALLSSTELHQLDYFTMQLLCQIVW